MPELWEKRVLVEGMLRRHGETGRPLSLRDITDIRILEPPVEESKDLWGILPVAAARKPEDIVRAGWDGG